jgi:hypothetical protein
VDDAQRHGGVRSAAAYFLDVGDTEDDEHPAIVVFVAGTLIGIADIRKEIIRDFEFFFQQALVFISWTCYLYPAVWLPLVEWRQSLFYVPVCLHCLLISKK